MNVTVSRAPGTARAVSPLELFFAPLTLIVGAAASTAVLVAVAIADTVNTSV